MRRWHNGRTVEQAVDDEIQARRCEQAEAIARVIGLDMHGDADEARLAVALGRRVLDDIKTLGNWSKATPERLNADSAVDYVRRIQEGL